MRRYDFEYTCDDSNRREVIEREHGDYVIYEDAARALEDERRQTQRRMIAALYWRAGVALTHIDPHTSFQQDRYWRREASLLGAAARTLEAAL